MNKGRKDKMDQIEELLEQVVYETITAALNRIIEKRKPFDPDSKKNCNTPSCPFSYDIQF